MSKAVAEPVSLLDKTSKLLARALKISPDTLSSSFRLATLADLPQILSLRAQVLGADITWDDEAYLRWRYRFGRAGQGGGDCFVVVLNGELLGLIGTEDVTLSWGDIAVSGVRMMDTLIQPELSSIGLGVWMSLLMKARYPLVLAVGANANSKGLVTRLFDVLPNRRILAHPVRFDRFMSKRLPSALLAWLSGRLAGVLMWFVRAWALGLGHQGISIDRLPTLPEQIDGLLRASQEPGVIEVARSRERLVWRLSTPRSQFDIWAARKQGELVGLMVTRRDPIDGGQGAWTVMDLVLDRRCKPAAAKALFWAVLVAAQRQKIEHVLMPSYRRDLEPLLRKAGFVELPNDLKIMAWSCENAGLRAHGESGADWSFNELHSDGG